MLHICIANRCILTTLSVVLFKIADNKGMEGYTVTELAKLLKVQEKTVNVRLFRLGIKPLTRKALYDKTVLNQLEAVKMGRPKKAK